MLGRGLAAIIAAAIAIACASPPAAAQDYPVAPDPRD